MKLMCLCCLLNVGKLLLIQLLQGSEFRLKCLSLVLVVVVEAKLVEDASVHRFQ